MTSIFISHSGLNNDSAIKVREWLRSQGWKDTFLDLDPAGGLAPGQRWQEELKRAGEKCAAVIVLVSPQWAASSWCRTEFLVAVQLGKLIFPVIVSPTPFQDLPVELIAHFQLADISTPANEKLGLDRLSVGLKRAGLDPSYFPWPPVNDEWRSPFRGLAPLDEADAGIFFGRDWPITSALDSLRRMRGGARERGLVILGASGSGKSSFLRAGLMSRLRRDDENYLLLSPVRPERVAMSGARGFVAALAQSNDEHGPIGPAAAKLACDRGPQALKVLFGRLRNPVLEAMKRRAEAGQELFSQVAPTIVIAIDQAEELFDGDSREPAEFLRLMAGVAAIDSGVLFVATIRSESYARWQAAPELADAPHVPFNLPVLSAASFREVIEGPPKLARPPLALAPDLVETLISELGTPDALPLLGSTLAQLDQACRLKGLATLDDYKALGGFEGTISRMADAALEHALQDPGLPDDLGAVSALAKKLFIPHLVAVKVDTLEPVRRLARYDKLPQDVKPLVRHFIDQRLITSDTRIVDDTGVEILDVVHEAVLRRWSKLAAWIAEERDALVYLEHLKNSAAEWDRHDRQSAWLQHQDDRLNSALELSKRQGFDSILGQTVDAYLLECRALDRERKEAERSRLEQEKKQVAATRQFQKIAAGALAAFALLLVVGAVRALFVAREENLRASRILAGMAETSADQGLYDRAARLALAGMTGSHAALTGFDSTDARLALVRASNALMLKWSVRAHKGVVESAALSRDGRRILTTGDDGLIKLWDTASGRCLKVIDGKSGRVTNGEISPDGMHAVTTSVDDTVRFWDLATGKQAGALPSKLTELQNVSYSPDGRSIVVAAGSVASIWNVTSKSRLHSLAGHDETVLSVAFSRDGSRVVTGSQDKTAIVWNVANGQRIATLAGNDPHKGFINSVAFSPDGQQVVTGSIDETARVWNAWTGALLLKLQGHEGAVNSVRYSRDNKWIVTAANDGTTRIWDAKSGLELVRLVGGYASVYSAEVSDAANSIVTGDNDAFLKTWSIPRDIAFTDTLAEFSSHFSRDGKTLLIASQNGRALIVERATGKVVWTSPALAKPMITAVFSRDERRVLTSSMTGTATIWDVQSGTSLKDFSGSGHILSSAVFSPDERYVLTAGDDGYLRAFDAGTGSQVATALQSTNGAVNANYSPDGRLVVSVGGDEFVRVWSADTLSLLHRLAGHEGLVDDAQFTPDSALIVSAGDDGTLKVWDAKTYALVRTIVGHRSRAISVAISPHGDRIASVSSDRTARVWDLRTGQELSRFEDYTQPLRWVAFSSDGTKISTTARDNAVRVHIVAGPGAPRTARLSGDELASSVCSGPLKSGLGEYSREEAATVAQLASHASQDACSGFGR